MDYYRGKRVPLAVVNAVAASVIPAPVSTCVHRKIGNIGGEDHVEADRAGETGGLVRVTRNVP